MNLDCDPRLYSQDYAQLCKNNCVYWDKTSCYYLFLILKRLGITHFCRDLKIYLCQRFFTVPVPTFAHYVFLVESKLMYHTFAKELLHSLCTQKMTVVTEKMDENVLACLLKSLFLSEFGPVVITGKNNDTFYNLMSFVDTISFESDTYWYIWKICTDGCFRTLVSHCFGDKGLQYESKLLIYFYKKGKGQWDFNKEKDRNAFMSQYLLKQTFLIVYED